MLHDELRSSNDVRGSFLQIYSLALALSAKTMNRVSYGPKSKLTVVLPSCMR
jgi:hypothetical protein